MNTTKVVLVTGTTSGFGRLIAETLAREGYTVYASMRESTGKNKAAAQELVALAAEEALNLHVIDLDVTDDASVKQAIAHIVTTSGLLDVVVNNAGVGSQGPLEAHSDEQIYHIFDSNVFGVLRVNLAALPKMRAQGTGLLIHIGSVLGRTAMPFFGLYSATKFALEGLIETFNYELRLLDSGIDSIVIEPGAYPTQFEQKAVTASDPIRIQPYEPFLTQMGSFGALSMEDDRVPNPQEVADKVSELIAMPAGSRPLRTVVALPGQGEGAIAVNRASAQVIQAISSRLGITATTAKSN